MVWCDWLNGPYIVLLWLISIYVLPNGIPCAQISNVHARWCWVARLRDWGVLGVWPVQHNLTIICNLFIYLFIYYYFYFMFMRILINSLYKTRLTTIHYQIYNSPVFACFNKIIFNKLHFWQELSLFRRRITVSLQPQHSFTTSPQVTNRHKKFEHCAFVMDDNFTKMDHI